MQDTLMNLQDFSRDPSFRSPKQGEYSAEEFRDKHVIPALDKLEKNSKLILNLDGTRGISPSFLEELFGGLIRKNTLNKNWQEKIEITSDAIPEYKAYAIECIMDALNQKT